MTSKITRDNIDELGRRQRWNIWFHYCLTQLGLKYNFYDHPIYVEEEEPGYNSRFKKGDKYPGFPEPDKVINNIGIYYCWKDIRYKDFPEFDNKNDLWEWYWRFKDDISL